VGALWKTEQAPEGRKKIRACNMRVIEVRFNPQYLPMHYD
jgi:hypothetical protein